MFKGSPLYLKKFRKQVYMFLFVKEKMEIRHTFDFEKMNDLEGQ